MGFYALSPGDGLLLDHISSSLCLPFLLHQEQTFADRSRNCASWPMTAGPTSQTRRRPSTLYREGGETAAGALHGRLNPTAEGRMKKPFESEEGTCADPRSRPGRMEARRRNARALLVRFSQSLTSLRQWLSQAMLRLTIQRLGRTSKPLASSERLTISIPIAAGAPSVRRGRRVLRRRHRQKILPAEETVCQVRRAAKGRRHDPERLSNARRRQ